MIITDILEETADTDNSQLESNSKAVKGNKNFLHCACHDNY